MIILVLFDVLLFSIIAIVLYHDFYYSGYS